MTVKNLAASVHGRLMDRARATKRPFQELLQYYPRETVIAEKFQAMVYLGAQNSRMKDFYDIWLLARQFEFKGERSRRPCSPLSRTVGQQST